MTFLTIVVVVYLGIGAGLATGLLLTLAALPEQIAMLAQLRGFEATLRLKVLMLAVTWVAWPFILID